MSEKGTFMFLRWKHECPLFAALAVLLGAVVACSSGSRVAGKPAFRVLCGSSMATPMQEIGAVFAQERNVDVQYDFGGSETLLPKVIAGVQADIYVCHDPFEEKVRAAGQCAGSALVGYLEPVLAVRPGNPKQIRTLEDLARPEVRLGIGDPQYSTCGEMFVAMLEQKGLKAKVMPQVAVQMRSHSELANGLIAGPLDAVVIWNFAAALYKDKLQVVDLKVPYKPVRVTAVGLARSANPAVRDAFLEFCRTEKVQTAFKGHGYVKSTMKDE